MRARRPFLLSLLVMVVLGAALSPLFPWSGLVAGLAGGWLARTPRRAVPAAVGAALLGLALTAAGWPGGGPLGGGVLAGWRAAAPGAAFGLGLCALLLGAVLGASAAAGRYPRSFPDPRLRDRRT